MSKKNGNGKIKKAPRHPNEQECRNKRQALAQLKRLRTQGGLSIEFRNPNQQKFYESITDNDVTFCSGPAGCGKTFLAMHYAIQALATKGTNLDGIIVIKPLVEANGEKLGHLPGDIDEKTDPYMWSYHYNIEQIIGKQRMGVLLDESIIRFMPLAFMRGITLSDKIVILDESQNTIPEQIKMFLTRIGSGSKYIICGDLDQTDRKGMNGLEDSMRRFETLEGVGFCRFDRGDIVRHEIVGRLLDRYNGEHYH